MITNDINQYSVGDRVKFISPVFLIGKTATVSSIYNGYLRVLLDDRTSTPSDDGGWLPERFEKLKSNTTRLEHAIKKPSDDGHGTTNHGQCGTNSTGGVTISGGSFTRDGTIYGVGGPYRSNPFDRDETKRAPVVVTDHRGNTVFDIIDTGSDFIIEKPTIAKKPERDHSIHKLGQGFVSNDDIWAAVKAFGDGIF